MRRRRMTRAFQTTPIDRAVLDGLLDAARRTPTAGNTQGVELLVLDQPESVARYWNTTFTPEGRANFRWQGLFDAPVLVSVYGDPDAYVERYADTMSCLPNQLAQQLTRIQALDVRAIGETGTGGRREGSALLPPRPDPHG